MGGGVVGCLWWEWGGWSGMAWRTEGGVCLCGREGKGNGNGHQGRLGACGMRASLPLSSYL